ncbi:protein ANTAGONIST OF LIKE HETEROCHROMATIN PROTEIN 1-like [Lytechinus variegatus]|uniref:protein ANTAGONIST OF LIKE HETEROCHROMATIN PROTEIN 1-like n=1 Tax=Lytechinus variegatus TaxID=7654 RepID=UPI001BB25409|nr:protein ANTAGONIST OF LIKE HETEROCHROMATIN PROTEIN 1-like [Lytechinus variegatus]
MDTKFRKAIRPEHRLAITLWRLATNVEYRTLAGLFGVGRSTVGFIVVDTCQEIINVFQERMIRIPAGQKLEECVARFAGRFPQAVGAIDGSHIPIKAPVKNPKDYFNRKGFYSVILQGVVDSFGSFIDVNVGWPGSVHDARVFTNSTIYQKLMNGSAFPEQPIQIGGCNVPLLLLGDPAYPLLPNLMKPFSDNGRLTNEQITFNNKLSSCRITVEHTFGRLKGRWRILHKTMDHELKNVPNIIMTCCILHNIIEMHHDPFMNQWEVDAIENNGQEIAQQDPVHANARNIPQAATVRNALKEHLAY